MSPLLRRRLFLAILLALPLALTGCSDDDPDDERLAMLVEEIDQAQGQQSDRLFDAAVDRVAAEGGLPDELAAPLGEHARAHIDRLVARATDVSAERTTNVCAAVEFTRHLIRAGAASSIYAGGLEYVRDLLAAAGGDEALSGEAGQMGGLVGLLTAADEAAGSVEDRVGVRQAFLRGLGLISESIGSENPEIDQVIDDLVAGSVENPDDEEGVYDPAAIRFQSGAAILNALAVYEYRVRGTWTTEEVVEATRDAVANPVDADTDFFADGTTGERRPVKAVADMSGDELDAYNDWLNSDQVLNEVGGARTVAGQAMQDVSNDAEDCD